MVQPQLMPFIDSSLIFTNFTMECEKDFSREKKNDTNKQDFLLTNTKRYRIQNLVQSFFEKKTQVKWSLKALEFIGIKCRRSKSSCVVCCSIFQLASTLIYSFLVLNIVVNLS